MNNSIKLELSSILHVPLQNYEEKFTFIVNKEEFLTNRLVADLLSPKISKQHLVDPTISEYIVNTRHPGNFNKILDLVKFETQTFTNDDLPFIFEILENFENTNKYLTIEMCENDKEEEDISDISSTIKQLQKNLEFPLFYESKIAQEIESISSHFYEMSTNDKKAVENMSYEVIESILSSGNLRVASEDEVVEFINELYLKDREFSSLYCYVYFSNVTSKCMRSFVEKVSLDDITSETWNSLRVRLCEEINDNLSGSEMKETIKERYVINVKCDNNQRKPFKTILYENQKLNGLINFLKNENNIKEEIDITSSSIGSGGTGDPWSVISYNEEKNHFYTNSDNPSWICIEFKKHEIIPTSYTIKSGDDNYNPKNFVLEGSKDKNEWTEIDTENYCSDLKEKQSMKTFSIQKDKQKPFKYLRLHVEQGWINTSLTQFRSIEFYGDLI